MFYDERDFLDHPSDFCQWQRPVVGLALWVAEASDDAENALFQQLVVWRLQDEKAARPKDTCQFADGFRGAGNMFEDVETGNTVKGRSCKR